MTDWWKHPNTWCVVVIVSGLTGLAMLEFGLAAGRIQAREVNAADESPRLVETLKPVSDTVDEEYYDHPEVIRFIEMLRTHDERKRTYQGAERLKAIRKNKDDERNRRNAQGMEAKPGGRS